MADVREMINCQHLDSDGVCQVASKLSGRPVVPWEKVCGACAACVAPQQVNYVTASIAAHAWVRDAQDPQTAAALRAEFSMSGLFRIGRPGTQTAIDGPGTELLAIFSSLRIKPRSGCNCKTLMRIMNQLGVTGCRKNRTYLLERLRKNASKYSLVDMIRAAIAAGTTGMAYRIDLADPIAWCFDFAVASAEQKQAQRSVASGTRVDFGYRGK